MGVLDAGLSSIRLLEDKRPDHEFAFTAGSRSTDIKVGAAKRPPSRPDGREASGTAQGKRTDLGPDRTQVDRCSATNRRHQSAACASGLIHTIS